MIKYLARSYWISIFWWTRGSSPESTCGIAFTFGYQKRDSVSQAALIQQRGPLNYAYRSPHFREVVFADDLMAKT